ncbi:NAD-dependent epimerase/dehydratase family protein [Rhodococcus sp. X156]|uniref:NAD-dependent epimerase/dehydratase family protein n=1 Tax=Rhodococcus sp. X156 TaxID=2499145 RepID=UPI000FDA9855|nr:NAD-dependent epimerase/dehydratase family protein [Rhodococcus sp. X156]
MKVLVLGGDGFCGWPSAVHLSRAGHEVTIVDNLVRRRTDDELGVQSLTPIAPIAERLAAWEEATGLGIGYEDLDLAQDYDRLLAVLDGLRPDAVVHFAEQRSAPYSMEDSGHKRYTVDNNVNATHNVLTGLVEARLDAHLVHLGTTGVYGYETSPVDLPEGYLEVTYPDRCGGTVTREILYPTKPGSVYHLTKSMDQLLLQYYAENDNLRVTDLHQGIVWGTQTDDTRLDDRLVNRFDYDGDFGTVLNRFLMQAAIGYPLTVHGTGGQTRAFINIADSVRCVRLAVESADQVKGRVRIMNQLAETLRVEDLARLVAGMLDGSIDHVSNPRVEAAANELALRNSNLRALGFQPILVSEGLMQESIEIATRYADRCDRSKIRAESFWTRDRRAAAEEGQ